MTKLQAPSARIEWWLLYLQQFNNTIRHIRGKNNSADVLSRLPVGEVETADAKESKAYACSIASQAVPAALTPKEVELAWEHDKTPMLVRKAITTGDWTYLAGTMYKALSDELWVLGQLVMRGERIVMPESLRKRSVTLAHEGHQGMVRTKARLREKVWWPHMDEQVEQFVKACYPCQLVGPRAKPEPVRSTKLPEGPWTDIAIDLVEIPGGNHLLVAVDNYTRWPEVILLKKTDARHVITAMEGIFRTHGLPVSVRSDNGPPFTSKEFDAFLEYQGIEHKKGIPYWPQSNGEVERCNRTILKVIRIANLEGTDWKRAQESFLFQYRTTPQATTGMSPAELLMGRKLREKLPRLKIPNDRATEAEWQQLLRERDALAKLRQKEYTDLRQSAEHSNIVEGDEVLLRQTRENKLSPNFEPEPYKVIEKDGNAVVIADAEGNTKMRNAAHMKKLVQTTEPDAESQSRGQAESQGMQSAPPEPSEVPAPPPELPADLVPRPACTKQPPFWLKDCVPK